MDTGGQSATPILVTVRTDYSCSWHWGLSSCTHCSFTVLIYRNCLRLGEPLVSYTLSVDQPLKTRAVVDRGVWPGARDTVTVRAYGGTHVGARARGQARAVGEQHRLRLSSAINNKSERLHINVAPSFRFV